MEAKLDHAGVTDYEVFNARTLADLPLPRGAYHRMNGRCAPAIYATTLAAYSYALSKGWDRFVYMEDDVYLCHDYLEQLGRAMPFLKTMDMAYLGFQIWSANPAERVQFAPRRQAVTVSRIQLSAVSATSSPSRGDRGIGGPTRTLIRVP